MAVAASVVLAAPLAEAVDRKGFVFGFGLGVGHSRIQGESNTAAGSDLHIGGMLGDKTALLLEAYGVTDSEEGLTATLGVSTFAVQRWLGEKVWLKAGVGTGFAYFAGEGESEFEDYGVGILAAAGYELLQKQSFTLDLQGRFSTASRSGVRMNNYGVDLGLNWW